TFRHVPYTWRDLQSKKGVRRKLNVVRRALFPSAERMALRYGIPPDAMSPRQQIAFRWQNLARHAVKTLHRLSHSDLAVMSAVRNKNNLSVWMHQSREEMNL
ncbi:MAG: hypothetical protein KC421_25225, partial [Anaerolineales bacterium]|nr:hypothetical protein [Anaerolineales bacterium]